MLLRVWMRTAGLLLAASTHSAAAGVAADCLQPVPSGGSGDAAAQHAQPWLVDSGLGRLFSGGKWGVPARKPAGKPRRASGADANGHFQRVSCDWPATAGGGPALRTTAIHYAAAGAVVYELAFPNGATRTNVSVPGGPAVQHTQYGVNTDGVAPFAEFPVFDLSRGRAANSSWFTWHGGLQYHDTATGTVQGGKGFRFIKNLTGLTYGPVVLFDESQADASYPVAVVSPMTNVNVGAMNVRAERLWAHGPSWELTAVPAGFTHRTLVMTGTAIRPTLRKWGAFMLAAHGTKRLADPSLDYLGVFTDNGAFYDAGFWPSWQGNKDGNAIFANLSASYRSLAIPVHYIQLDDWWYGNASAKVQTTQKIVVCTESFTPTTTTGQPPDARNPSLFPKGLKPLREQFGGLMLYMVNFCPKNAYLSPEDAATSFLDSFSFPGSKNQNYFVNPKAEASEAAYGRVMDAGIAQGMTAFEIDFMERNFEMTPYYRDTAGAADGWLAGLSRAAAARNLPTQLCSDSARDVIASAALPAVTQFRGSMDFACDCSAEPLSGNWDVGQQSLLISSLGLGASKDTFMTSPVEAGINHGEAGGCPVNNGHAELDLFLATLTSGPVGVGDGINDTNRTLLMRCCAQDGMVLRADTASTPIDATWAQSSLRKLPVERAGSPGKPKAAAAVWTASTTRNDSAWHFVTAIDVPTSFVLQPLDLWPATTGPVLHRRWHAPACVDGQAASLCGVQLGLPDVATGLPVNRCQNKTQDNRTCTWRGVHNWELTTVAPVTPSGLALLGELSKVVSVSSARISSVMTTSDTGGLRVTVKGTPGETVQLAFVFAAQTHPTSRITVAVVKPSGEAIVTVQPSGEVSGDI
eukprot:SAG22_NODE_2012_length_3141_cov_3.171269_1_plen_863_part_00